MPLSGAELLVAAGAAATTTMCSVPSPRPDAVFIDHNANSSTWVQNRRGRSKSQQHPAPRHQKKIGRQGEPLGAEPKPNTHDRNLSNIQHLVTRRRSLRPISSRHLRRIITALRPYNLSSITAPRHQKKNRSPRGTPRGAEPKHNTHDRNLSNIQHLVTRRRSVTAFTQTSSNLGRSQNHLNPSRNERGAKTRALNSIENHIKLSLPKKP